MEHIAQIEQQIADWATIHLTIVILIGVGLVLTIVPRGAQLCLFPEMMRTALGLRKGADGSIPPFQALVVSLAARVGIGNVFGVAVAFMLGGPDAVLRMWAVALAGMATVFFEATLAQIFKVKRSDGSFRGGPVYYIKHGTKNRVLANILAVATAVTCGIVIAFVQSNAIVNTFTSTLDEAVKQPLSSAGGFPTTQFTVASLIFVFSAMIIFGGVCTIVHVTEWMALAMATIYVIIVAIVRLMNITQFGIALGQTSTSVFSMDAMVGSLDGSIITTMINGTKRNFFLNRAGQSTAPNAAVITTVSYLVRQGLIQSLDVFIDTIVVCTATAFAIFIAGEKVWSDADVNSPNLTTLAVVNELGAWTIVPTVILIFVLAYSSIIATYVYSDTNISLVFGGARWATWAARAMCVAPATIGALLILDVVWNTVDIAMTIMTITNLMALVFLARWMLDALRDYEAQCRDSAAEPVFMDEKNPLLPSDAPGSVWERPKQKKK